MPEPYKVRRQACVYAAAFILVLIASALQVSAETYENVSNVFNSFNWDEIKMQVRTCADPSCVAASFIGPDNTSNTYFTWPNDVNTTQFLLNTNLTSNQYFQYKAYLSTTSNSSTPGLYSVSMEYNNNPTWTTDPVITPSPAYSSAQLGCTATGYSTDNFTLSFRWYNGTNLYNETNTSSQDQTAQTAYLPAGIQQYNETWNCSVRLYINPATYTDWKTATTAITDNTYAGTDDVFYDFQQNYAAQDYTNCSTRFQTRACNAPDCSDASFIGPDNTANTYYADQSSYTLSSETKRYFQFVAYMSTVNNTKTPALFYVLIYAIFSNSDTFQANVTVGNSAPSISDVNLNDNDGGSIQLIVSSDSNWIICNATLTDLNGYSDITGATAMFYHSTSTSPSADDRNTHYTNSSCTLFGGSGTTEYANCTALFEHEALNGTWTCNVTATDASSATGSGAGTNTVDQLIALAVWNNSIDFNSMAVGSNSTTGKGINLSNEGNVVIDLDVKALTADMSCNTGAGNCIGAIGVGNLTFNMTSGTYDNMKAGGFTLSTTNQTVSAFNLGVQGIATADTVNSTKNLYWGILIPQGVKGEFNVNITVSALID